MIPPTSTHNNCRPRFLTWEEIETAAHSIFDLFPHGRERAWAQDAWRHLTDAGLTAYTDGAGRCRAAVRLLALSSVYWCWCKVADWQETDGDELTWWADELDISTFRLGQLVGPDFGEDEEDEDALRRAALGHLTYEARPEVVAALKRSYGGDDGLFLALWRICNPAPPAPKPKQVTPPATAATPAATQTSLFPDLEASSSQPTLFDDAPAEPVARGGEGDQDDVEDSENGGDEEFGRYEDDWSALNNLTDQKLRAYEWIAEGCPTVR